MYIIFVTICILTVPSPGIVSRQNCKRTMAVQAVLVLGCMTVGIASVMVDITAKEGESSL